MVEAAFGEFFDGYTITTTTTNTRSRDVGVSCVECGGAFERGYTEREIWFGKALALVVEIAAGGVVEEHVVWVVGFCILGGFECGAGA